jgi:hypothetical protein
VRWQRWLPNQRRGQHGGKGSVFSEHQSSWVQKDSEFIGPSGNEGAIKHDGLGNKSRLNSRRGSRKEGRNQTTKKVVRRESKSWETGGGRAATAGEIAGLVVNVTSCVVGGQSAPAGVGTGRVALSCSVAS